MVKAEPPVEPTSPDLKIYCASFLIKWIPKLSFIVFLISGFYAITGYYCILTGNIPTEIQKLILDYSLSIFAGNALFLLIYVHELEKIISILLDIKEVEPLK